MKRFLLIVFIFLFVTGCQSKNETAVRQEVVINFPQDNTINGYCEDGVNSPNIIPENEVSFPKYETITVSLCGNKNSKIFHKLNCKSITKTKEENKIYLASKDEFIKNGYSPCKICNP